MNTKQTEALKLALEALEASVDLVSNEAREVEKKYIGVPTRLAKVRGMAALEVAHKKAITVSREALAAVPEAHKQPAQQEPVDKSGSPCPEFWDWLPKAYNFDGDGVFTKYNMEVAFLAGKQSVHAVDTLSERVDKTAKNRHEQTAQQQEPIAWIERDMNCDEFDPDSITYQKPDTSVDGWEWVPLYTSPPNVLTARASKPWVGLTQEDMYEIGEFKNTHGYVPTGFKRLVAAIEAKLREKNT